MIKIYSQRKKKTILTALILGLCFSVSGHTCAADASDFETPEYFKGTGLDIINASKAYAKGYTGKGVTVGISDEPVNFTSPEFSTKQITTPVPDFYPVYEDWEGQEYTVKDAEYWGLVDHGTHVAGTIAASRNELGMHGVAFDAEILSSTHIEKVHPYGDDNREDWRKHFLTLLS